MKTNYRRQHNHKRHFSRILLVLLVFSIIIAALYSSGLLANLIRNTYSMIVNNITRVEHGTQTAFSLLAPKSNLIKENQKLRSTIKDLNYNKLYNSVLEQENQNLRTLLHALNGEEIGTLARIIDYRNIPYGTLLIKAEDVGDIHIGDTVTLGKWAIGTVVQINGKILLVNLFTASGNAYDVLLGDIVGTFYGMSNGTGEVLLSRTKTVKVGTVVTLPSQGGLMLGIVEAIEHENEDSLQTVRIKIPFNIDTLRFVTIKRI